MRTPKLFVLAALLALILSGCTKLFFHPHSFLIDTPEQYGIKYQIENFQAADGTALNAWFLPANNRNGATAKTTVLFLHGNAENISTHFRSVAWLPAAGFNVLALDYRGYGASEGIPSLTGMQQDIDAAMRHLLSHKDVDPNRIVVFGQSLGGALAIHYVAHSAYRGNIRAVVIDSAFYDYRQIAREKLSLSLFSWPFQWLPWLVIDNDYSPAASIAAISPLPLLLMHGDQDVVVPPHHSQQLFDHANQPKELWVVPGAGHTQSLASAAVRDRLVEFLRRHTDQY
ncbi:MAG: alpha/beta fold hydrolase [Nitrosomonadales bacterium]|nr:alpha/beta fold hydrolase [Nitrosomonadales bacterium]